MAVAWRLSIFLLALLVFGAMFAMVDIAVPFLEAQALGYADTEETAQLLGWTTQFWLFTPVFALIAAGAWLLKQGVVVSS